MTPNQAACLKTIVGELIEAERNHAVACVITNPHRGELAELRDNLQAAFDKALTLCTKDPK